MTNTVLTEWDELVLPFQLPVSNIRGRFARLDASLAEMLAQHDYPAEVKGLLAEAAMITALIGQTIGLRWKLSLQIRGDGPIRIIATDYFAPHEDGAPARMRAFASVDYDRLDSAQGTAFEKIGKGMFAVLIDQGNKTEPYQGITPLTGGSLARCAETYFAQSEQLPTRFEIVTGQSQTQDTQGWRAGGIMIQHMPDASPLRADATEEDQKPKFDQNDEDWQRVNILLDTVEETELIGPHLPMPNLLYRLFHEEEPQITDAQAVQFGCTCSEDKVRQTMSIYSQKDISKMIAANGMVTADCQFCGMHYELDPKTLGFEGIAS
ncbi:MAG: Hsp33 family molecular chaperone HslO [Pseudomonadota bacterium]